MNILYDSQAFQMQKYGGITRYFCEIIRRAARRKGSEVSLFLGLNRNRYGLDQLKPECKHFFGWVHPDLPRTYPHFTKINHLLLKAFARASKPDLYHPTFYHPYLPNLRAPRVITVYDMIDEKFPDTQPGAAAVSAMKRASVSRADRIIAISHSTKRDLVDMLGVAPDKVVVTHLAASQPLPHPPKPPVEGDYLLYVGLRGGYKNFAFALRGFARLAASRKDLRMVCCGGMRFGLKERALVHRLRLSGRVLQYSCTNLELAGFYTHAIAFIFPSLYEGFGIPPLEAMSYGCPVLASDRSSIPEVIGDAGLYFDPTDLDHYTSTLQRVLDDTELRQRLARLGREQVHRFSWDRCFDQTMDVYRSLLG